MLFYLRLMILCTRKAENHAEIHQLFDSDF